MISCRKATKLISKAEDESLSIFEKIILIIHMSMCWCCRRFQKQLRAIGVTAKYLVEDQAVFDSHDDNDLLCMREETKEEILQKIQAALKKE